MGEETIDTLHDLIGRLERAEAHLIDLAEERRPLIHERIRLEGKANGVRVALRDTREALEATVVRRVCTPNGTTHRIRPDESLGQPLRDLGWWTETRRHSGWERDQ
jgi:hypothetical protein